MIRDRRLGRLAGPARWVLVVAVCAVACDNGSPRDDGPCKYELRELEPTDMTPWGVPVGEEIAQLAGPYLGTWTWSSSTEEIEIENADQSFEAEAVFEVDVESFRVNEHVGGGAGVACWADAVQADGLLAFRDSDGLIIASIPVTVERTMDQPVYQVQVQISPLAAFSTQLTELAAVTGTSIRALIHWGVEGESLGATFEYIGQTNGPSGGEGFIVSVAAFSQEGG